MMSLDEVMKVVGELKGRYDSPFGSADKEMIANLYQVVLGKEFRPTTCQQCYHDALIEVYLFIKRNQKMAENSNYVLKAGAIVHSPVFMDGQVFTNDNLTDEVAEGYLRMFPGQKVIFARVKDGFDPMQPENKPAGAANGGKVEDGKPLTLKEAQAGLKKAQTGLKSTEGRLSSAKKKLEEAQDEESKKKAKVAVEKAEASVEKSEKNVAEWESLVKELTEGQSDEDGDGGSEDSTAESEESQEEGGESSAESEEESE